MYKKISNKILNVAVVCSGFVITLVLLHLFVGRPIIKHANKLKSEFKLKQAKLQESEALIRSFPNPQKAIEDIEKKTQELKDKGVTPKQIPRLIQLLARPAGELNLSVISIRPRDDLKSSDETLPAGVSKIHIEVVISGSYQLIGEYIKALSELPLAFTIERLSIEKKEERESAVYAAAKKASEKSEEKQGLLATLLVSIYTMWEI